MFCKANRPRDKTKKPLMGRVSTCVNLRSGRVLSRAFYDTSTCNLKNEEFDLRLNTLSHCYKKKKKGRIQGSRNVLYLKNIFLQLAHEVNLMLSKEFSGFKVADELTKYVVVMTYSTLRKCSDFDIAISG